MNADIDKWANLCEFQVKYLLMDNNLSKTLVRYFVTNRLFMQIVQIYYI